MADNYTLGKDCKLYYSTTKLDGSGNTPATVSWTEIDNVGDVTTGLEKEEADITTRANNGWKQTIGVLKDGGIEFEMSWKPSDAAFTALLNAWLNDTEVAGMALDGSKDTAGKQGLASNFNVTNFSRREPLRDAVKVAVTIKPSSYSTWYTVGS